MQKLTDVLAMGGYGSYVWPSFAVAFVVMAIMAGTSWRSLKRSQKAIAKLQQSDES
jgi:heme exporter protein CcmD